MKKLYFIVGSQDLYGEECLKQVAEDSRQMVAFLNEKVGDLAEIELLPTVETSEICIQDMRKASNDDDCVGVITWMHTFSPAKMWIKGLQELRKPLLHLHTQANEKLPYDEIDMDFMNLNQSAHGDREYGFIVARMGIPHEVVAGYYKHDDVVAKIRQFASVAKAISYSKSLKVASFGNNMREVADGVHWALDHPDASREELLENLIRIIKGPDFPTGATILGHKGIEQAYRTGRGLITMRAVVNTEEINGRMCLVVTELPYQVNPDRLVVSIREAVRDGKIQGIADMRDETSGRTGQRLVLVLKRDAVPKVVLNNLYKHSQLQQTFGANMLALVDGVPRTLSLDAFIRHWVNHQLDVIARRTAYLKREAEERDHILQGYLKALDMLDEVIALIRASEDTDTARTGLMGLLDIDQVQADAILAMQLRTLTRMNRDKIVAEHEELQRKIADYIDILAKPERQRKIIGDELDEIVAKYGDDRRTKILPFSGEMNVEDLIAEENVVVTVTHSGFIKRTKADEYRSQHRGGKGIKGTKLREDDVVDHFFLTSTHNWLLFFTNKGRVYRIKAYELPEGSRDSKGQHVANLLQFAPDESIQTVLSIPNYEVAKYLVLATRSGKVKKTPLAEYDSPRQGGLIAVRLMADENGENADELIGAALCNAEDDIILVSKLGMSLKFQADDEQLRPMGRQTAGVQGMKFRNDDSLLAMDVVPGDSDKDLFVVTNEGFAKRTAISEYRLQGRNGLGIKAVQLVEGRGALVGALVVSEDDQVMAIMKSGKVIRSNVDEVKRTGRNTQGVTFAKPDKGDTILSIARNEEKDEPEDGGDAAANGTAETAQSGENVNNADEA